MARPDSVGTGRADAGTPLLVQGEVLDAANGRPLRDVLVVLHDLWKFTRTDSLGYFAFPRVPAGEHELGVYGLGYITVEQVVDFSFPNDVFAVNLAPAPVEIEGLTVDLLSRDEVTYRSFGQRYDYIGPKLMETFRNKYGQIADMLRVRFPGIRVWDPGGPGTGLCIRNQRGTTSMYGGESDFGCALMFIDGVEADGVTVAELDPDEVESIRYIARLEARLVYGERGRYGVLLVTTRTGR